MSTFFFPPPPQVANSPQPYSGHATVPPSIANVRVDQPPYSATEREPQSVAIAYAWRPDVWPYVFLGNDQPYRAFVMPAVFEAVRVDNPPSFSEAATPENVVIQMMWQPDPWTYTFTGGWQPFQPWRLPVRYNYYGFDDPPYYGSRSPTLMAVEASMWQPDPWPPVFIGTGQPYQKRNANPNDVRSIVNNPPFTLMAEQVDAMSITALWQPPAPWEFMGGRQMLQQRLAPPSLIASRVDNPPYNQHRYVNDWNLVASWQPLPPNPTLAQHSVYPILPLGYSFGIVIV